MALTLGKAIKKQHSSFSCATPKLSLWTLEIGICRSRSIFVGYLHMTLLTSFLLQKIPAPDSILVVILTCSVQTIALFLFMCYPHFQSRQWCSTTLHFTGGITYFNRGQVEECMQSLKKSFNPRINQSRVLLVKCSEQPSYKWQHRWFRRPPPQHLTIVLNFHPRQQAEAEAEADTETLCNIASFYAREQYLLEWINIHLLCLNPILSNGSSTYTNIIVLLSTFHHPVVASELMVS